MAVYAVNMTHAAPVCPIFNEETRKKYSEGARKKEEAAEKYKIRVLSAYVAVLEHLILCIFEAPSQSAVEGYLKETGWASYNNVQIREVQPVEEAQKSYGLI